LRQFANLDCDGLGVGAEFLATDGARGFLGHDNSCVSGGPAFPLASAVQQLAAFYDDMAYRDQWAVASGQWVVGSGHCPLATAHYLGAPTVFLTASAAASRTMASGSLVET